MDAPSDSKHPKAEDIARALVDVVGDLAKLTSGAERVDQAASPLGPRRHIRAVRRLLAAGDPRAGRAGRRYFLTGEAVDEELARLGRDQLRGAASPPRESAELLGELGLEEVR